MARTATKSEVKDDVNPGKKGVVLLIRHIQFSNGNNDAMAITNELSSYHKDKYDIVHVNEMEHPDHMRYTFILQLRRDN